MFDVPMAALLSRHRFAFLLLLGSAVILSFFIFRPILHQVYSVVDLYYQSLQADTPTVKLYHHRLEFDGVIPTTIRQENGVTLFFDHQANDSLLAASATWSVYIAQDFIKIKTPAKIRELPINQISVEDNEPLVLEPLKLKRLIARFLTLLKWGGGLLVAVSTLAMLYLIAAISAGIGLMIDAFRNGPNDFTFYFGLGAVLVLIYTVLRVVVPANVPFRLTALSYLIVYLALSYLIVSKQLSKG